MPIACLQDAADELSNAMKRVFPGIQVIMCYYHWERENVSIEERSALNKLQIFHRCLCYKNSRYK